MTSIVLVSTLSELLRERADQHGEEVLAAAMMPGLACSPRSVQFMHGVEHEAMRLPPYGERF